MENRRKQGFKISLIYFIFSSLFIAVVLILGLIYLLNKKSNYLPYPISEQAVKQLGFNIYYPDRQLLPGGYSLNMNSFSSANQVLIFSVSYNNNQNIVFSEQMKPSDSRIQTFYSKYIPLNTSLSTSIGVATIGAITTQTIASLPTNTNTWIIITAPRNINQAKLGQVIKAIEISK